MSWRTKKSTCNRLTSIAAIALIAAGCANEASAGTNSAQSAETTGSSLDRSSGDKVATADTVPSDTVASGDAVAAGDTAATPSSVNPGPRAPGRVRTGGSLQHRVDVLAKALQLDARQRTQLLTILESQRQAVSNIWSDPKLLPAERTPATRALQERTADQIRAILSEQQKKLYNPPKPQGDAPPSPNVADWMKKQTQAQARQQQ